MNIGRIARMDKRELNKELSLTAEKMRQLRNRRPAECRKLKQYELKLKQALSLRNVYEYSLMSEDTMAATIGYLLG